VIASLRGALLRKEAAPGGVAFAVLDVGGVGYRAFVSTGTFASLPEPGGEAFLHTVTVVREDSLSLFGFADADELALFNLLPVPPLDGGGLIGGLLPTRYREGWHHIQQLGPLLLVAVFFFGGRLIAGPVNALAALFFSLTRALAPGLP